MPRRMRLPEIQRSAASRVNPACVAGGEIERPVKLPLFQFIMIMNCEGNSQDRMRQGNNRLAACCKRGQTGQPLSGHAIYKSNSTAIQ